MRPECKFCTEYGLALKTGTLPNEEMIVVTLQRLAIYIEYFIAQMQAHTAIRPAYHSSIRFFHKIALVIEIFTPTYRVAHFQFDSSENYEWKHFLDTEFWKKNPSIL